MYYNCMTEKTFRYTDNSISTCSSFLPNANATYKMWKARLLHTLTLTL